MSGRAQSDGSSPGGATPPTNLIYSSDTVIVKVVKLTGIKIVVPASKLVAGEEVNKASYMQYLYTVLLHYCLPAYYGISLIILGY